VVLSRGAVDVQGPVDRLTIRAGWVDVIKESFHQPGSAPLWFAVEVGGEVGGVGGLNVNNPGYGWLGPSYVPPGWRGRRFQRLLIDARVDELRKRSFREARTCVQTGNDVSLTNLLACGFAEYKTQPGQVWLRKEL
jgi:L-amino acid N-acyltransferase YncA